MTRRQPLVTPPPATTGDTVAVVAPSSQLPSRVVETGVARLERVTGLEATVYPSVTADTRLPPSTRAAEITTAFESEAKAVFAIGGGDDEMRIIRHLDLPRLRDNPTRFFGISDNTHLHLVLSEAGIVSYYGCQFVPGIACDTSVAGFTKEYLTRALFDEAVGTIDAADTFTDEPFDRDINPDRTWEPASGWSWEWNGGSVTGTVWGGCGIVIEHMMALDAVSVPPHSGPIVLAIETSGLLPQAYYPKAVIRCLGERGLLESVQAVLVGRAKTQGENARLSTDRETYRSTQRSAIAEAIADYLDPVNIIYDLDFGHTDPQIPIPIGGEVKIDPDEESITFGGS